jgi:protein-histidine N-methyltransferase
MFKFNFSFDQENNNIKINEEETPVVVDSTNLTTESNSDYFSQVKNGIYSYEDLIELNNNNSEDKIFKQFYLNKNLNEDFYDEEEDENETEESRLSNELADQAKYSVINYIDCYRLENNKGTQDDDEILNKINKTHDIVPGKYEGGLKVWELSMDLARLIYNLNSFDLDLIQNENVRQELSSVRDFFRSAFTTREGSTSLKFNILELGCGHALPALSVLKLIEDHFAKNTESVDSGSKTIEVSVYLQDFNENIVKNITFENVRKFLNESNSESKIGYDFRFVYGDWRQIILDQDNILPKNFFNLILTSETIYNSQNYKSLLNIFKECLSTQQNSTTQAKKLKTESFDSSCVLLSAKTYYFGCGGNVLEFVRMAKSSAYSFKISDNLLIEQVINNDTSNSSNAKNSSEEIIDLASISKEIIKLTF